jgi:hypothetical protein
MTTLLQEFEEWLNDYCGDDGDEWYSVIASAEMKLEELKKKHNVV